jgi:hypothetical protein
VRQRQQHDVRTRGVRGDSGATTGGGTGAQEAVVLQEAA